MKGPLKFYVRPDSKALEDILRMYQDKENNPEFKDATVVFIDSEIANSYSKIVNDMSDDTKIEDHMKKYQPGKDYLEVKLSQLKSKNEIDIILDSIKERAKGFENADKIVTIDDNVECKTEFKEKEDAKNLSILDMILGFLARFFASKFKQKTKNIDTENKNVKNKEFKKTGPNVPAQELQKSSLQQDY